MAELSRGQILKDPEIYGTTTSGAKIRLRDGDESTYIDLKVPDTVTTSYVFTLPADDGLVNQVLQTDGSGTTSWATISLSPAGSDTQIQFNDGGSSFGGDADLTWNKTTNLLDITGNIQLKATGELRLADTDSSNYVAIKSPGTVAANRVYTLPAIIGSAGQVLKIAAGATATAATLEWANDETGGAGSSASGGSGDVQLSNGAGAFTSDTDLNFDTTNTRLNIGNKTAATGNLFVEGTFFETARLKITDPSASFGPILGLYRESSSPAGADGLGYIYFYGPYSVPTPPSTQQGVTFGILGMSILDPTEDSTAGGSIGPNAKLNLYLTTKDNGTIAATRTVDYSSNQHRHVINWAVANNIYSGYRYEVTTSANGGTNNITPAANSVLNEFLYQGNIKYQLGIDGVTTQFGLSLADSDASNFVDIKAPATVTNNYTITLPAAGGAANEVLQFDASQNASFVSNTKTLNFVVHGGGSAVTTGIKGYAVLDADYTLTAWTLIGDVLGACTVTVGRSAAPTYPVTSAITYSNIITASLTATQEGAQTTGLTTTMTAGDVLEFNVTANAGNHTNLTIALRLVPR